MYFPSFSYGWAKKAGRIYCPAPLPEEPAGPLLMKMLVPALYKASKKKTEKEAAPGLLGLLSAFFSGVL